MKIRINREATTHYISLLCIVDVLFFPYLRVLSSTVSMFVLALWCVLNLHTVMRFRTEISITLIIILSTFIGIALYNNYSGITNSVMLVYAVFLNAFIVRFGRKIDIGKILKAYLFFSSLFAVLYLVLPQLYFNVRSIWTMGNTEISFAVRTINRFTLFYSDPNDAANIYVGILVFLILYTEEKKTLNMLLYIALSMVCIISTVSISGMLSFLICFAALLFFNSKNRTFVRTIIGCAIIVLVIIAVFGIPRNLVSSDIIGSYLKRFELNTSDNSYGGRTIKWKNAIENCFSYYNFIIGKGGVYDNLGKVFLPHSGYLYMLISYGLPSVFLYHKVFFSQAKLLKIKYYIALIPFLMIMLMNTGIGDFRYLSTMAILTAYIRIRNDEYVSLTQRNEVL